jgi:hypothetical protein
LSTADHWSTSTQLLASTASRPAFVTTRDPPLLPERDAMNKAVIWLESETEYFYAEIWTGQISLKSLSNFRFARSGFFSDPAAP